MRVLVLLPAATLQVGVRCFYGSKMIDRSHQNNDNMQASKTLYHCTSEQNQISIQRNGFRCGSSGLAGGGIYFAETAEDARRKAHQTGVVLKCEVELGKVQKLGFHGDESLHGSRLKEMGCDSVSIARKGTEYCLYEPQRVAVVEVRDAEWLRRQQQRKEAEAKRWGTYSNGAPKPKFSNNDY